MTGGGQGAHGRDGGELVHLQGVREVEVQVVQVVQQLLHLHPGVDYHSDSEPHHGELHAGPGGVGAPHSRDFVLHLQVLLEVQVLQRCKRCSADHPR